MIADPFMFGALVAGSTLFNLGTPVALFAGFGLGGLLANAIGQKAAAKAQAA